MPIEFSLQERVAGFAAATVRDGETVPVVTRELVSPEDGFRLNDRLQRMQGLIFDKIPGLPPPSYIDHLLVVIGRDLTGIAYVNELTNIRADVRLQRPVEEGETIHVADIRDISAIDLGVKIERDWAVVFVRSFGWRKSLFFDFEPLHDEQERDYELSEVLAAQALMLIGIPAGTGSGEEAPATIELMARGLESLRGMVSSGESSEARYQELLEQHPWMLGGMYSGFTRHPRFDDHWIPDFVSSRCHDGFHDIVEIKQPFLSLFKQDDTLNSNFNDAWNQAEGYLAFAVRQKDYLREEKQILIENPRCVLLAGYNLTDNQRRRIREKEARSISVTVMTYEELINVAENMYRLVSTAGERQFE